MAFHKTAKDLPVRVAGILALLGMVVSGLNLGLFLMEGNKLDFINFAGCILPALAGLLFALACFVPLERPKQWLGVGYLLLGVVGLADSVSYVMALSYVWGRFDWTNPLVFVWMLLLVSSALMLLAGVAMFYTYTGRPVPRRAGLVLLALAAAGQVTYLGVVTWSSGNFGRTLVSAASYLLPLAAGFLVRICEEGGNTPTSGPREGS